MEGEEFSLDDVLGNGPAEEPEQTGQPRDEHGRFSSTAGDMEQAEPEPTETPPVSEESEPTHIPFAALKDERTKRQQAEAERQAMEARLQQYNAYFNQLQNQQQPEVNDDPVALIAEQIRQQIMPDVQMQVLTARVDVAETLARQKWQDYDDKVELFKEEAQKNPFLVQQVMQATNPAEYAYNVATQIAQARGYNNSPAPSREEMMAQIREELKAEMGLSNRQAPQTLANQRSVGTRTAQVSTAPFSINDVLP